MEVMWLYSMCQCILFASVTAVSVRLCLALTRKGTVADIQGIQESPSRSVSGCLLLCLGLVGALGGAVELPVTVLLNLRTPQCLYTCITLVCGPLLIRQFTMFLVMLLSLDAHLKHHLAHRYSSVVTRQRALCVVLLCWVASVLCSFAQFIGSDVLHTWRGGGDGTTEGPDSGSSGLGLEGNWTTSSPRPMTFPIPKYYEDRKVIGKFLPYGGFLSKFYVEDMHNFTYAEIHSSHWGVCSADTLLTPQFLVYVYGFTVFMLPLLCLLGIYFDLLCMKPKQRDADTAKRASSHVCSLALSISLLVVLCLPVHIIHSLAIFAPNTSVPAWVHEAGVYLFQVYSVVPPVLFAPPKKRAGPRQSFPLRVPHLPPAVDTSRGKAVHKALCEAVQAAQWASAKHSLKAKVCPDV